MLSAPPHRRLHIVELIDLKATQLTEVLLRDAPRRHPMQLSSSGRCQTDSAPEAVWVAATCRAGSAKL